jgi:plastocyanin
MCSDRRIDRLRAGIQLAMRLCRLALPVLVLSLALVAPAVAGEQAVQVIDYDFSPKAVQIQPGDTVRWDFAGDAQHSATSSKGQPERWDSGIVDKGGVYSHTFTKPGRFQYICLPHREFMKGVVQVGEDTVPVSYAGTKTSVRGKRAATRYELLEAASVTAVLRGPKRARIDVKRAEVGKGSVAWGKKLPVGRYRGTLSFVDDFDKKSVKQVSFKIR